MLVVVTVAQYPDPCAPPPSWPCPPASSLQLASPVAQLAPGPPAFDLPSIDFPFSLHTPLFFQPSLFYFSFPIHYITLLYLTLIARHISAQRNNTGHAIAQDSQGLLVSCPPLPAFACPSVLDIDPDDLDAPTHHNHPIAFVSASRLGTDDFTTACRRLPALCAHQGFGPTPH
ncbi:hypothetical protein FJTKL_04777 [Diaporthe vaccinii]|uniref:Uncharacterized protein n=1 Tax=Diaporthe vaccinii TaxID=105482 RepID=A0ABR4F022_9PEZI